MSGAICGGVISVSKFKEDPMAYLMCFVMADDKYKEYTTFKKQGKDKEASKLFDKYAMSQI